MSDYVRDPNFFGNKDSLASGNPNKVVVGAELDTEYNDAATAINSKFDDSDSGVPNGLCPLDSSALVPTVNLPNATEAFKGALEVATTAEAEALAADDKIITPLKAKAAMAAWGNENAGIVTDLQQLADPAADRILFWDDNGKVTQYLAPGNGVAISGTTLLANDSEINHNQLLNYDADRHVAHSAVTVTAGTGLTGGGNLSSNFTINLDLDTLPSTIGNSIRGTDVWVASNAGTDARIQHQDMGVPVNNFVAGFTLTDADMNIAHVHEGANDATVLLNTGVGTVGNVIMLVQTAAGQITVGGTATVESASGFFSTATEGSVAFLFHRATNQWVMYGDLGTT